MADRELSRNRGNSARHLETCETCFRTVGQRDNARQITVMTDDRDEVHVVVEPLAEALEQGFLSGPHLVEAATPPIDRALDVVSFAAMEGELCHLLPVETFVNHLDVDADRSASGDRQQPHGARVAPVAVESRGASQLGLAVRSQQELYS